MLLQAMAKTWYHQATGKPLEFTSTAVADFHGKNLGAGAGLLFHQKIWIPPIKNGYYIDLYGTRRCQKMESTNVSTSDHHQIVIVFWNRPTK